MQNTPQFDTMYILHAQHIDKSNPYAYPIDISWSIGRFMTLDDAIKFASPMDDRYELTKCWLEVRLLPIGSAYRD